MSLTLGNAIESSIQKLKKEPLFLYCERRKARIVKEDTFPVSLLIRANFFKDGFELPPRVNCLKLISDLNWNTAPLKWYAEKQIYTWPLGQLEHKLPLQDLLLHLRGPE